MQNEAPGAEVTAIRCGCAAPSLAAVRPPPGARYERRALRLCRAHHTGWPAGMLRITIGGADRIDALRQVPVERAHGLRGIPRRRGLHAAHRPAHRDCARRPTLVSSRRSARRRRPLLPRSLVQLPKAAAGDPSVRPTAERATTERRSEHAPLRFARRRPGQTRRRRGPQDGVAVRVLSDRFEGLGTENRQLEAGDSKVKTAEAAEQPLRSFSDGNGADDTPQRSPENVRRPGAQRQPRRSTRRRRAPSPLRRERPDAAG